MARRGALHWGARGLAAATIARGMTHLLREGLWQCAHCRYSTNHKRDLVSHIQQEHLAGKGFPGYRCPQCPALPTCLRDLDLHLHSAHGGPLPTAYSLACSVCKIEFRTQDILKAHMKEVHSLSEPEITKALSKSHVESSEEEEVELRRDNRKQEPEAKNRFSSSPRLSPVKERLPSRYSFNNT